MRFNYLIKSFLFFAILLGNQLVIGQSNAIDRYYEKFKDDDRFTQVTVSSKMFSLFVNFERDDPEEQAIVETISKLKGMKMMLGKEIDGSETLFSKVINSPSTDMEELMSIDDPEKEIKFYITESGGKISEIFMAGHTEQEIILISLVGDINLKEIAALSKKMDIDGFEQFEKLGDQ